MTPAQLAAVESWRNAFHPDVMAWLHNALWAARHYHERGGASSGLVEGFEALERLAREMAVRE